MANLYGCKLTMAEQIDYGPSMWAEITMQSCNTESHSAAFMCQQQSKANKIQKFCPVPAHLTCMSEHIQHTCTQCLMHAPHTSTSGYVVLSSPHFIRLNLWSGIPRSLRNIDPRNEAEVDLRSCSSEETCHWSPSRLLVSLSLFLLPLIAHSIPPLLS